MISLFESKIGRDPTKYILPQFLKNNEDLLLAIKNRSDLWINYFSSLKILVKDVKYLNAIIDSGNTEYIKFYNGENWDLGLRYACKGGNMECVELMIQKGANQWNDVLREACIGGHMEIVELLIQKGANNWNWGLEGACLGGYMECVELMIENGANDLNCGLRGACEGGHKEIVKIMIQKGGKSYDFYWDIGLQGACQGGYMDCVELMIENGASNIKEHFDKLIKNGHLEIFEYLENYFKSYCAQHGLNHNSLR
jgi:ankyrin repeat protein